MLNILDWFRGRSRHGRQATEVYGSIVAQGRNPAFYTAYGIRDVAEKRYEMIVLHMIMVLERLRNLHTEHPPEKNADLAQALTEAFVRDLDGSMREMAVGDTKVPAKVRKAAGGLYDRDILYRDAFAHEDRGPVPHREAARNRADGNVDSGAIAVESLLEELIFTDGDAVRAAALADYMSAARAVLADWSPGTAVDSGVDEGPTVVPPFPEPKQFLDGRVG